MFTFSGDYEWASWSKGVECGNCSRLSKPVLADGVQLKNKHSTIVVTPTCKSCITSGMFIEFEM